jgi:hypothetical protein
MLRGLKDVSMVAILIGSIFFLMGFALSVGAQALPENWRVDQSLFPKAYGVLADEHLMHLVDVSNWPVKIDNSRQFFVDDYLIASMTDLNRQIQPARKHPNNPLIIPEKPWEDKNCFFPFVFHDEKTGKFRMWYSGSSGFTHPITGEDVSWPGCYAESADGIKWTKPNLGLHVFRGFKENNIVIPEGGFFGLLYTPNDPDPNRQYKAMIRRFQNTPLEGYFLYISPDGIHWQREREERLIPSQYEQKLPVPGVGDTSIFRWDEHLKKYVGDIKILLPGEIRVRGMMESDDLIHWSRPRIVFYPDGLDDPNAQIYGHIGFFYESMWIGLMRVMHNDFVPNSYKQTTIELTASRDGRHWYRVGNRDQFIPLGQPTEWDPHYLDACTAPILVGDELRFYYSSTPLWKDGRDKVGRIGLAILPRDRFVSLDAGNQPGTVVTRPLTFAGKTLFVNAEVANSGYIKAELRNGAGKPVSTYTLDKCTPVCGDVLNEVTWEDQKTIMHDPSQSLRVVFKLKNAKLYSFWIE